MSVTAFAVLLPLAPARGADEWDALRTVLFGSAEAGPSSFVNAGFKRALGPSLDRDGWLLLGTAGGGLRRERVEGTALEATRVSTIASGLLGHQWMIDRTVVAVFGGVEIDHKQLVVAGDVLRWSEPRLGARAQVEIWSHPSERTLATLTLIGGSARFHAWTRASWGYEVWKGAYAGPEAVAYLQGDYREGRLGLHLTGLRFGGASLGVSAGGSFTEVRTGGYVSLSGHMRM